MKLWTDLHLDSFSLFWFKIYFVVYAVGNNQLYSDIICTHALARVYTHTHTHTHSHAHSHTLFLSHARTHRYTRIHTHMYSRTGANTRTHTQSHTHTHTHTHTHSHTHTLSSSIGHCVKLNRPHVAATRPSATQNRVHQDAHLSRWQRRQHCDHSRQHCPRWILSTLQLSKAIRASVYVICIRVTSALTNGYQHWQCGLHLQRCSQLSLMQCLCLGSRDSLSVRAPDPWSRGCEFESRQERRENFLLQS